MDAMTGGFLIREIITFFIGLIAGGLITCLITRKAIRSLVMGRAIIAIRATFDSDDEIKSAYIKKIDTFLHEKCSVTKAKKRLRASKELLKLLFYDKE